MRLLNTSTNELTEFLQPPDYLSYATLSHRWTDQEVSFEEYSLLRDEALSELPPWLTGRTERIRHKSGYDKIISACKTARRQGHDWLWVDTCCIDKRSSAELTEAINSMWAWYNNSSVCLVHFAEVGAGHGAILDKDALTKQLEQSTWFTRSWT
jgi:hypothetical protein